MATYLFFPSLVLSDSSGLGGRGSDGSCLVSPSWTGDFPCYQVAVLCTADPVTPLEHIHPACGHKESQEGAESLMCVFQVEMCYTCKTYTEFQSIV